MRGAAECRLYADESGNDSDALQVLAGLSGEARALEDLELRLKASLALHGVKELKWAALRTRSARLAVARDFLGLACQAALRGGVWVDLMVLEGASARRSWEALKGRERWMALYQGLIARCRRRHAAASWSLHPDQRTGMPWKLLGKLGGLKKVQECRSKDSALIQLADLLAGLTRFSHEARQDTAERARLRRQELLDEFTLMLQEGRLANRAFKLWRIRNLRGVKRG